MAWEMAKYIFPHTKIPWLFHDLSPTFMAWPDLFPDRFGIPKTLVSSICVHEQEYTC